MSKSPLPWLLVVLAVTSVAIVAVVGVAGSAQGATPDLEAPPTSATLEAFHAYTEAQLKLWREELASLTVEIELKGDEALREQVRALQERLDLVQEELDTLKLASGETLVNLRLALERMMWELSRSIEDLRSR